MGIQITMDLFTNLQMIIAAYQLQDKLEVTKEELDEIEIKMRKEVQQA